MTAALQLRDKPQRYLVRPTTRWELGWLEKHAAIKLAPDAVGMVAVDNEGEPRGMVAFEEFSDASCRIHQAGVPIAARALVPAVLMFAFEVMGLDCLRGSVCSNNRKALRMNTRLGFVETGRDINYHGDGKDRIHMELRRKDCRWLRKAGA